MLLHFIWRPMAQRSVTITVMIGGPGFKSRLGLYFLLFHVTPVYRATLFAFIEPKCPQLSTQESTIPAIIPDGNERQGRAFQRTALRQAPATLRPQEQTVCGRRVSSHWFLPVLLALTASRHRLETPQGQSVGFSPSFAFILFFVFSWWVVWQALVRGTEHGAWAQMHD